MRERVVVYVTREGLASRELLVFEHRDEPEAGLQVPAGGLMSGEAIEQAAAREVIEETGVDGIRVLRRIGTQTGIAEDGSPHHSTFVWANASPATLDSWEHEVSGGGEDDGLVFSCRFEPLPLRAALAGGQDEFLQAIPG